MSLEVLEKFALESNNDELIGAVNSVKESYKGNVERLSFLEKDMRTAVQKRDDLKSLVKHKLGVEDLTEDALDGFLTKVKSGSDEVSKSEIKNLSSMVEMLKLEKESIASKYSETLNGYKIEKQLTSLGAIEETEGSKAYDIVLNEVRQNASFDEDGRVIFKANDGTTIRNADGSPMSLADRYNQLKDSEELSFLFKTKRTKAGSSATGGKPSNKITSLDGLNDDQRRALFVQDPALFRQLAGLK